MKRLLTLALAAGAFFLVGFTMRDLQAARMPSTQALGNLLGKPSAEPLTLSASGLFGEALADIERNYAKPVDVSELRYAGIGGMVASLGDPHTMFLEPQMAQEFALETMGNFVGVGARLTSDPMGAKAVSVFEDGPAMRAGLKPGDVITGVDGKSVVGWPTDDIVKLIRGEEGTSVVLTVLRTKLAESLDLSMIRRPIVVPSVESKVLEGSGVGYIAVTSFSEPTIDQFSKALDKLTAASVKGLVIDLRGNPGGLLNTASEMLSHFLDGQTVVTMRMREGSEQVEKTPRGRVRPNLPPVAVLLDENSASASEIFAGVLREANLAALVGDHSYGKASVQNVLPLRDKSSLKITIAKYYLPSGADISRKVDADGQYISGGLKPDVEVKLNLDQAPVIGDPNSDNQLAEAVKVVLGQAKA
ncbi:MAG: S41 family peptidase [Fimbriimonadaceae bacterium]|nr:S41 family peptidase [Fimbriimonadaceae bacterium]